MKIGIIGYGNRINDMIEEMNKLNNEVTVAAICDIRNDQIKEEFIKKGIELPHFYASSEELLKQVDLDGVLIGTRCSQHASYAAKVLTRSRLPLFLEKPVATNEQDLLQLKQAYEKYQNEIVVSFPLRLSPLVQLAKELLISDKIGAVAHVQAYNNVPYGSVYFQSWYRDEQETGGLFLQKATHDFDYINYLLDQKPISICAMKSKQVFKGNKPAGLTCEECTDKATCPESAFLKRQRGEEPKGEYCAFAVDTGNEDSGSAIIRYESGMHVNYSQNFIARRSAELRGARLIGFKGTIEFDFTTSQLDVHLHHEPRKETYKIDSKEKGHAGGDTKLAQNFLDLMQGKGKSNSPLEAGLLSAWMCIKARESSETDRFQSIEWD